LDDRRQTPSDGKSVKSPKSNLFQDKSALYHIMSHYSVVFVIFINFFGQLKDWVGQVLFLVSCPKGQVKKYVNVDAWTDVVFFLGSPTDNSVQVMLINLDLTITDYMHCYSLEGLISKH
jgi:hypothetical protein